VKQDFLCTNWLYKHRFTNVHVCIVASNLGSSYDPSNFSCRQRLYLQSEEQHLTAQRQMCHGLRRNSVCVSWYLVNGAGPWRGKKCAGTRPVFGPLIHYYSNWSSLYGNWSSFFTWFLYRSVQFLYVVSLQVCVRQVSLQICIAIGPVSLRGIMKKTY